MLDGFAEPSKVVRTIKQEKPLLKFRSLALGLVATCAVLVVTGPSSSAEPDASPAKPDSKPFTLEVMTENDTVSVQFTPLYEVDTSSAKAVVESFAAYEQSRWDMSSLDNSTQGEVHAAVMKLLEPAESKLFDKDVLEGYRSIRKARNADKEKYPTTELRAGDSVDRANRKAKRGFKRRLPLEVEDGIKEIDGKKLVYATRSLATLKTNMDTMKIVETKKRIERCRFEVVKTKDGWRINSYQFRSFPYSKGMANYTTQAAMLKFIGSYEFDDSTLPKLDQTTPTKAAEYFKDNLMERYFGLQRAACTAYYKKLGEILEGLITPELMEIETKMLKEHTRDQDMPSVKVDWVEDLSDGRKQVKFACPSGSNSNCVVLWMKPVDQDGATVWKIDSVYDCREQGKNKERPTLYISVVYDYITSFQRLR